MAILTPPIFVALASAITLTVLVDTLVTLLLLAYPMVLIAATFKFSAAIGERFAGPSKVLMTFFYVIFEIIVTGAIAFGACVWMLQK